MTEEMDSYKPNDGAISFKVQQQTLYDAHYHLCCSGYAHSETKCEVKAVSMLGQALQKENAQGKFAVLHTPWCRSLLEKLSGLQLVKKLPAFHGTRRFITALTSVRHLSIPLYAARCFP